MGWGKSNSKRAVHSNTSHTQDVRKISNKQSNLPFKIIRKAQFNNVADNKALIGDGASACASGSQKCTGASPILVPIPNNIKTNHNLSQNGVNWDAFLYKSS